MRFSVYFARRAVSAPFFLLRGSPAVLLFTSRREARLRKKMDQEGEEAPSPETPSSDDTTTAKSRSGPSGWQKWKVRKDNVTKAKWAGQQTVWSGGRCLNFGVQRVELSPEQRSVGVQTEFPNRYFRPVPTSSLRSEGAN